MPYGGSNTRTGLDYNLTLQPKIKKQKGLGESSGLPAFFEVYGYACADNCHGGNGSHRPS